MYVLISGLVDQFAFMRGNFSPNRIPHYYMDDLIEDFPKGEVVSIHL